MTFFSKERDALVFRYNGETVRIEAWNKDSLRVRFVMVGEISDYSAALLEPDATQHKISISISNANDG